MYTWDENSARSQYFLFSIERGSNEIYEFYYFEITRDPEQSSVTKTSIKEKLLFLSI